MASSLIQPAVIAKYHPERERRVSVLPTRDSSVAQGAPSERHGVLGPVLLEESFLLSNGHGSVTIWLQGLPASQPTVRLIIDAPLEALQAREHGQGLDVKDRILLISLWQVVIGDFRTEVMDVMETDVSTEPLQQSRELVERAA